MFDWIILRDIIIEFFFSSLRFCESSEYFVSHPSTVSIPCSTLFAFVRTSFYPRKINHRTEMMARSAPMAAPTEATVLTAAPVKGVVLLLGVTAPVPDADGTEAAGAAAAVVVG